MHEQDLAVVSCDAPVALVVAVPAHNPRSADASEIRPADIQVGRGQMQLELAGPNHVIQPQLLAAARLRCSVDPHLLGSKKLLGLGAAADQPGQLQQLTKRDRRALDSYVALDRAKLPVPLTGAPRTELDTSRSRSSGSLRRCRPPGQGCSVFVDAEPAGRGGAGCTSLPMGYERAEDPRNVQLAPCGRSISGVEER